MDIGKEYLCLCAEAAIITQFNTTLNEYYVHYTHFDRRLDEWVTADRIYPPEPVEPEVEGRKITRNMKRKLGGGRPEEDMLEREREESTKVKNIKVCLYSSGLWKDVVCGKYLIDAWYYSPYPEEYRNVDRLFVCQFCLKYMRYESTYKQHLTDCTSPKHPPGKCIYTKGVNKIYEIDGLKDKLYCQNLSLLSKLFLDHKTLYYDTSSFLFYVLTETDSSSDCITGYFSKERLSYDGFNLACIMVLPPYQKKGYGRLLIEFSYELSKLEGKLGSPEKPLSDLGVLGYKSFWKGAILDVLKVAKDVVSIDEVCEMTGIRMDDCVATLSEMQMVQYKKGDYVIEYLNGAVAKYIADHGIVTSRRVDPMCINWIKPYVAVKEI